MGKLKSRISCLLVLTFMFNLMASTAIASPWKQIAPGQAKKAKTQKTCFLIDIPGHWAEESMTKMNMRRVINGYEDLTFQPNKAITHAEAVVMLVRLLGLEDEAEQASTKKLKNSKNIPDWARGYVAVAVDRGILTEKDLADFQPNKPAKRYEIAVMALRAFDNSELEQEIVDDLNFIDADEIPAWAKAYVQQMFILQLMIGNPDQSFQPNKPITRAEMSVLLDKMEKLFPGSNPTENDEDNQDVEGVLTKVKVEDKNTGTLTIKKDDGRSISVDVTEESIIFVDKKRAELKQLKVNSNVEVIIDGDGVVLFIRADRAGTEPVEEDEVFEGTLESVVTVNNLTSITLKVDKTEVTLNLAKNAAITLNGKSATIEDLKPGQEIEATLTDGKVVALEAESYTTEVTGELTTVMLNGSTGKKQIEVKVGTTRYTYEVHKNAVIKQDGETVAFTALQTGSTVELEISDGIVVKVISETVAS